jgi:hypothetical protein
MTPAARSLELCRLKSAPRLAGIMLALLIAGAWCAQAAPRKAPPADPASLLIAELRRTFTLHGKRVPPEIFRDMGDGNIADSESIWVTVDVEAAIGSNLYADDIKEERGWVVQTRTVQGTSGGEETAYKFIGSTENGLLVAVASYNGGGTGTFHTLHILDVAAARAFDLEGKFYRRINLTSVRNVVLGDRWDGDVRIAKSLIIITTTRDGPTGTGPPKTTTLEARRP